MAQVTLETILAELKKFELRMDSRFEQVDSRFGQIDSRFDRIDFALSEIKQDVRVIREQTAHLTERE